MGIKLAVSRAWSAMSVTTRLVAVGVVAAVAMGVAGEVMRQNAEESRIEADNAEAKRARERAVKEESRRASLTPQQRAAEDSERARISKESQDRARAEEYRKRKAAEAEMAAISNERRRQDRAYDVTRQLKESLRDPASVRWHRVTSNIDGSVLCIDYGAKNGFGGIAREQVIVRRSELSKSASDWSRLCEEVVMYDMKGFAP